MSQFVPLGVLLAACDEAEMHHGGELTALQLRLLCTLHVVDIAKPQEQQTEDECQMH